MGKDGHLERVNCPFYVTAFFIFCIPKNAEKAHKFILTDTEEGRR